MSINFIDVIDRIKTLKNKETDTDVATLLGMTKGNLSNYKDRNSIPYEALFLFCEREHVLFDWLLTGEEPMRHEERQPPPAYSVKETPVEYERLDERRKKAAALIAVASDEDVDLILRILRHRAEGREIKKLLKEEG